MTKSTIRPAAAADIPFIGAIAEATNLFPAAMLDKMIGGYLDNSSKDIWFVHTDEKVVTAFGFCEPERMAEGVWNLLAIGVEPGWQGQGVGAQMMRYIEKTLTELEARILLVEAMGTPELKRTRDFYLKNGYTKEACIREYYEPNADKIVFRKKLKAYL